MPDAAGPPSPAGVPNAAAAPGAAAVPDTAAALATRTVRAKHAASLIVLRMASPAASIGAHPSEPVTDPQILMGMRGAKHRFMPNRLVFPGGRVDPVDLSTRGATPLSPATERALRKNANPKLAHAIAMAAARELREETGLSLGTPPRLDTLHYLARAVTPPASPIRFNARFLVVSEQYLTGSLGGDGELDGLRFYGVTEALALDLAAPTRRVLERLRQWLAMSTAERDAQANTPVLLRDRGWRME